MSSQAETFGYTERDLDALERTLSTERLAGYVERCDGNRKRAVALYEHNTAISQCLYGVIQGLEITLRNACHDILKSHFGEQWYETAGVLYHPQGPMVDKAIDDIHRGAKNVIPGRVVAALPLGFWTGLIGKQYEQTLYVPHLHRAFPNAIQQGGHKRLRRSDIASRLDDLRRLRNKIAHHERIIDLDLDGRYEQALTATAWICRTTAAWIFSSVAYCGNGWRNRI